jgi:hypothetical protein
MSQLDLKPRNQSKENILPIELTDILALITIQREELDLRQGIQAFLLATVKRRQLLARNLV